MMLCHPNISTEKKRLQKSASIFKKTSCIVILMALILSSQSIFPPVFAETASSSGKEVLFIEVSSKESITKLLSVGEKITGKISVSGGDNYINFKLFDPAGNVCLWLNVLQSADFSWGPVDHNGEYKLEFDNYFDSSSGNTVNLEFKISGSAEYSFPETVLLTIVAIIIIVIIAAVILMRFGNKKRST